MTEPQASSGKQYQPANALEVTTNQEFQDGSSEALDRSLPQRLKFQVFKLIRYIRGMRRITLIGISIALILLITLGYSFIPKDFKGTIEVQQYYFQVYCPINDHIAQRNFEEFIDGLHLTASSKAQLKKLKQFVDGDGDKSIDKYIVWVKAARPSNSSNYTQLYYCGYTRPWNSTDCSNPKPICSIPGPLFYVRKDQPIDVAWVYDIDETLAKELQIVGQYNSFGYCYDETKNGSSPENCKIEVKSVGKSECTYLDPTDLTAATSDKITVNYQQVPIGAHIHGLEVRPTFDGNPLSSISMDGRFGVGFQSMGNSDYYSLFNNYIPSGFVISPEEESYIKINRYDNFQPPGNLWYHDHAMHATYANVAMGLAGGYIIHDEKIDSRLPRNEHEIIIIIAAGYQTNVTEIHDDPNAHMKYNPLNSSFKSTSPPVFSRNQTYRLRILNGQFDAIFTNMRFVAGCQKTIDSTYDLNNCTYVLNLSVIGADSTLFDKPINEVTNFTLASAERIEFLLVINGGGINEFPNSITEVLFVSDGDRADVTNTYIRRKFNITGYVHNTIHPPIPESIGVPFYNLSSINPLPCTASQLSSPATSTNCIAARRMRPLFRDSKFNFYINGHYKFSESGASENPTIGTTEDWYFINTMLYFVPLPHPMHIHLISFQVMQRGNLKVAANISGSNCSFYEIDYYVDAGYKFSQPGNYSDNCLELRGTFNVDTDANHDLLKGYMPENRVNPNTTNLYGFDVEALDPDADKPTRKYTGLNCPDSKKYKYVCDDNLFVPTWYKHWKEVVTIYSGEYIRVRVRWASADYNEKQSSYPFFQVPQDQLIEFPGYVYHCHFLQHEDNELMRPIMMQPSPFMNKAIDNPLMRLCMIGKPEGWASRAQCINKILDCQ